MSIRLPSISSPLIGALRVPGDKSISHRAVMLGALAKGKTRIEHFLDGEDCLHTIQIFKQLGVSIEQEASNVLIDSEGFHAFQEPIQPLYFGNSGTTARLMLGILSGLPFHTVLHGDPYLTNRPMDRVVLPLREMGAKIDGRLNGRYLPLAVRGKELNGITYKMPVKSAQVKSALLFAGLFAEEATTIIEESKSRDHTEKMLKAFGANIEINDLSIRIEPSDQLIGREILVPGDISSAAFFLVAAAIVPESQLTIQQVGLNPTRTGIIDVLQQMGADIQVENLETSAGERYGDVKIAYSDLQGITISGDLIPRLIDEIPILALLATQASGKTVIRDAEELRVKETDRIKAVVEVLSTLGARIEEREDGMIIHGKTELTGGEVKSYGDHRMAMLAVIASLITKESVTIDDLSSIAISYPRFFDDLKKISQGGDELQEI